MDKLLKAEKAEFLIQTGEKILSVKELQLEGKRRMLANEFMNGVVNKELLVGRMFV
mgnify:CR=1 FL=1